MATRNGRFLQARTIITGRANTFFRILNTGEFDNRDPTKNAIKVTFDNGNGGVQRVDATFSLDFYARRDVEVDSFVAPDGGTVLGVYDALPNADFKSGRFLSKKPMDPTVGIPIIAAPSGGVSAVYRIFNSGENSFQLFSTNGNGGGVANIGNPIAKNESFDFATPSNKIILVKGTGTVEQHIEGIYDFIK